MSERRDERSHVTPRCGFTLIEALVAMAILTVGLLGLAQAFYLGMQHMSTSSANLIAREKAREAVESVHTARDTRTITWAQIRNVVGRRRLPRRRAAPATRPASTVWSTPPTTRRPAWKPA